MSELAKALAAAQSDFPDIGRSKEVTVQTKTGGQYSFKYAPLDAIVRAVQPVLLKHGLSFSQLLDNVDGKPALHTVLLHQSGEKLEAVCPLPMNGAPVSAQEFGSLVTYMRRYALVAALGIATEEDDDGNHASGNTVGDATSGDETTEAATPTEPFKPSELVIHWGPHKGKKLGQITKGQLWFFAEKWAIQDTPSEYDYLLKAAAVALHSGNDAEMQPDLATGTPIA